jgi:hypothetical protein
VHTRGQKYVGRTATASFPRAFCAYFIDYPELKSLNLNTPRAPPTYTLNHRGENLRVQEKKKEVLNLARDGYIESSTVAVPKQDF